MALLLRKEIHMIYKITLFDANCPSCTSGTASFFTEDIDEFEHNYFSDENVESNQLDDVWQAKSKKLTSKTQKSDEMFQQNETLITFFELSRIFETYFLQL